MRIEVVSDVWTTTVTVEKAAEFYFYFMMKGRERQSYTIEHFNANDSTTSQNNQNHLRHSRAARQFL